MSAPAAARAGAAPVHGSATPRETRERVTPLLDRLGITRVADLTGLDEIGIPVWAAYRPGGTTLAVSLGAAPDPDRAWIGAVMESIEIWHAENVVLPVQRATAAELGVPYDVRALTLAPGSPLHADTVLDWVPGRGLLSGAPIPVPRGLVALDFSAGPGWDDVLLAGSSNGTAVGATQAEAVLHAVLEVAERDGAVRGGGVRVDPDAVDGPPTPALAALLGAVRAAGAVVAVDELTTDLGLPTFSATVWAPELPVAFTGFGCHLDAGSAIARALAEAVLCRVGTVSGARDDLPTDLQDATTGSVAHAPPPGLQGGGAPPGPSVALPPHDVGPVAYARAATRACAERIRRHTGHEPVVVDLAHPDLGVPAVKVIAPGLRMLGVAEAVGRG